VIPSETLSVFINPDYGLDGYTTYAILNSDDGSLLDFKEVVVGDTLQLNFSPSTKYHLSIYRSSTIGGGNFTSMFTYLDIPVDKMMTIGLPTENYDIPTEPGENFKVTVRHQNTLKGITLSNAVGNTSFLNTINGFTATSEMQGKNGLNEHIITVIDNANKPHYLLFFTQEGIDSYSFDFSEFKAFDFEKQIENNELSFSAFIVQAMVATGDGLKKAFLAQQYNPFDGTATSSNYTLGYLEGFPLHHTFISANVKNSPKQSLVFTSSYTVPRDIVLTTPQKLASVNANFLNFSFDLPANFDRWTANWQWRSNDNSSAFTWNQYGENPSTPLIKLPEVLINQNPLLQDLSVLKLSRIDVVKGRFTYQQWLEHEFIQRSNAAEYEDLIWNESF
jgi:hypothetical protein